MSAAFAADIVPVPVSSPRIVEMALISDTIRFLYLASSYLALILVRKYAGMYKARRSLVAGQHAIPM
jgi:hypothetical protein